MIITAKKLRPRRLAAACALAFVALGALGATLNLAQDIQTAQVVLVAYLEGCGWLVGEEAVSQEDIRLPDAFDGAYADYLALQSAQGFDLSQYAGKTVQRYTYAVKNYPGLQEDIWASLLLYRDQVIGGEVFSNAGDGFLQGLAYPIQQ